MNETLSIESDFTDALSRSGFSPPDIVADGKIHRFDGPEDKRGKKNAWYVLHSDGLGGGAFGDWKTGFQSTWSSKSESSFTAEESAAWKRRMVELRQAADAERQRMQWRAADKAVSIWSSAREATADNPYCQRKKVKPFGLREFKDKHTLIVPIRNTAGDLVNLQFIFEDGSKRFLTGGEKTGCYYSFGGKPVDRILIVEGYATGASLHEATGLPVAVAFDAGNLTAVAKALRTKLPKCRLIVCADDDANTVGNPGMAKATAAAREIAGLLAVPDFGPDRPEGSTDFNDLAALDGLDALRKCIGAAAAPGGIKPGAESNGQGWASIEPFPDSLRPVAAFDMALLPESLRPWADDIAKRVQCPPDFIGATIIGALGVVIGRRIGVRPKRRDDWTEYGNQWVGIVGRPGVMKSPAMSAVLAPLKRLDYDASIQFENELALFEAESKVHKMRQDAGEKRAMASLKKNPDAMVSLPEAEGPDEPVHQRYLVIDATVEKLADICAGNPQGVGVFRDELVSLLKSLEREGQESARGFYLTGWNGNDSYVVDRIMRGHQRIEAVCLSVIGSTQPGRLSEYLRGAITGGAADDGLMQRFGVLVWPDVPRDTWENVDCWPDAQAKQVAYSVFKKLSVADPVEEWQGEVPLGPDGEPDGNPPFLRLDDEAAELFVEWRTEHENELRGGDLHPAMESHLAKYRKLVPSIALVLHLADGGTGPVTLAAMDRALEWAEYLRSHAERAYGSVLLAEVSGAKALLKRIKAGAVDDGFTARDVYRNQWSGLENREVATKAIAVLVDHGYLITETPETGGRSKSIYRIHPEARK